MPATKPRQYQTNATTWRKLRAIVLQLHPICTDCQRTPASVADHIDGDAMNNEMVNLTGLCASCHSRKTVAKDGGFGRKPGRVKVKGCDENGNPFGRADW